jgi:hypothetical protein
MGDIEAAVRELSYLNKLLHILDPEELSQSSSLVSQVQDLLNSFNFSRDIDDGRCEDQGSELEFPHTAEDHSERELNISELSRSHSFDFSSESDVDSITDLYLETLLTQETSNELEYTMSPTEKEFEFRKIMEHILSAIDTVGDTDAAVQELDRVNELLHMLDPDELSRSSSLVSHIQDLLNSFNISNEVDDQRCEKDQVSELEVPRTEATDDSEHDMHIPELSSLVPAYIPAPYPFIPVTYSTTADFTLDNSGPGAEISDSLSSTDSSDLVQVVKVFDNSFDDEMCAIYNLYTDTFETTESPSHTEFDLRAEFISPKPCAFSIQKIVIDTSDPRANCSLSYEPEDDPPSYQESIAVVERSYSYA